jgi:hypothetical protein
MIRALGFVICLPLALCLGVYGCTAAHLYAIGNVLSPASPRVTPAHGPLPPSVPRLVAVAPGLWCCDLNAGGSGIVDANGHTYQRMPQGWVRQLDR